MMPAFMDLTDFLLLNGVVQVALRSSGLEGLALFSLALPLSFNSVPRLRELQL